MSDHYDSRVVFESLSGPHPLPCDVSVREALSDLLGVRDVRVEPVRLSRGPAESLRAAEPCARSLSEVLDMKYGFQAVLKGYDLYERLRQRFDRDEVIPLGRRLEDKTHLARSSLRSVALYAEYFRRVGEYVISGRCAHLLMAMRSERAIVLYDRNGMHHWRVMTD